MYLEEHVGQLEQLSVQQGRRLETVARGLADLTVDVCAIREDVTEGFTEVKQEFGRVWHEFARVNQRLDDLPTAQVEMQITQHDVQTQLGDVWDKQKLILKILTDRLR